MNTTIIGIHGRGLKPRQDVLSELWLDALTHGVASVSKDAVATLNAAQWDFVYFGDLTNAYLAEQGEVLDESLDTEDRRHCLAQLKARKRKSFLSRSLYERVPGKNSIGEFLADVGQPVLRGLGLSGVLIQRFAPDYVGYWDTFHDALVARITEALRQPFARGDRVVLIAHCLGSVAAYDALWSLEHGATPSWYEGTKVHRLITFGSPLGDETVKKQLLGSGLSGPEAYPANILHWMNVAAEDDYIAHDNAVANDFAAMLRYHLVSSIEDDKILNLAVRYGRSNPHNALGYLVHPVVGRLIVNALV